MKQRGKEDYEKRAWYAYIVRQEASFDGRAGDPVDDFEIDIEKVDEVLEGMQVNWYPLDRDDEVEKKYFGMRQQWRTRLQ